MYRMILFILALLNISFGWQVISSDTLSHWLKQGFAPFEFILIDIREARELNSIIGSETCGAYNYPYGSGEFEKIIENLPRDTAIILYCASGSRSAQAASGLDSLEFTRIYSLSGGMSSWNGPTLPANQVKSPSLFPEIFCSGTVSALSAGELKLPSGFLTSFKELDLLGRARTFTAPAVIITTRKAAINIRSKPK